MIPITTAMALDERDLQFSFIRASGPGGQNVNKVSTAVQLRYEIARLAGMSDDMRMRLARLAGTRLTQDGEIVITAQRFRTQERNRQDAVDRLVELLRRASVKPVPRRATRPTRASQERRIAAKGRRATVKGLRSPPRADD